MTVYVMYKDIIIGKVLTNRSLTVEEALNVLAFDMDQFINDNNFDGIDYNEFTLVC